MLDYNKINESEFIDGIRHSNEKVSFDNLITTFQKILLECDLSTVNKFRRDYVKIWNDDKFVSNKTAHTYTVISCKNENYTICFENELHFPNGIKEFIREKCGTYYLRLEHNQSGIKENFHNTQKNIIKIAFRVKIKEIKDSHKQSKKVPLASVCIKQNENEQFVYLMENDDKDKSLNAENVFKRLGHYEFYKQLIPFINSLKEKWNFFLDSDMKIQEDNNGIIR